MSLRPCQSYMAKTFLGNMYIPIWNMWMHIFKKKYIGLKSVSICLLYLQWKACGVLGLYVSIYMSTKFQWNVNFYTFFQILVLNLSLLILEPRGQDSDVRGDRARWYWINYIFFILLFIMFIPNFLLKYFGFISGSGVFVVFSFATRTD
jgi:hypothetical protein